jgi:pyrroline-5-carboxylate reductase
MSPRLVIVGFGNLGQAIARGAIESGIAAPSEIGAIEVMMSTLEAKLGEELAASERLGARISSMMADPESALMAVPAAAARWAGPPAPTPPASRSRSRPRSRW